MTDYEAANGDRTVIGIAGSLRAASWNRRLLDAARELVPPGLHIEPFDIRTIPLYDADLDTDERRPQSVRRLKTAIGDADGVLIVSPEYNHTVPGVVQNVIDWASRPGMRSPLAHKPVGFMGASNGLVGTARMQQVLKLTLLSTLARVMPHPGVVVSKVADKFDSDGRLTDKPTREFIGAYLRQLLAWIETAGHRDSVGSLTS